MRKKLTSIITLLSLLSSGAVPVMADSVITVPGTVIYEQDFEGEVDEEIFTEIGNNSAFSFVVEDDLGNKALKVNGYSAYGYNKFGPEYTDAIVKADVKQIRANGSKAAYFGIGLRAARQGGGAYFSNMATYYDALTINEETNVYDASGKLVRDRIGIVSTKGADYAKFTSFDAMSDELGILERECIFTDSQAKANERNFCGKYYRMEASLIGNKLTNTVKTTAGENIKSLSAEVTPVSESGAGFTQLQAHSGVYLVDNLKIMSPIEISEMSVTTASQVVALGESTEFTITSGDTVIESDVARYEYDNTALNIDFANGTVAPLKTGAHTVKVYLDDMNSDASLVSEFTIEGKEVTEKLEVLVAEPNITLGEGAEVKAYFGENDITDSVTFEGASYSDGKLYPSEAGLCIVNASYDGQNVVIPIAVNDETEVLSEKADEAVFTEDFEGDATELTEAYSNGNANISVVSISNDNDGTTSNALLFNNIQASSSVFGPTDLVDYILEYDFYCPTPKGSSASFIGTTLRAGKNNAGYKVGYVPVMKYNSETHMVDTTLASATNNRQITVAYGPSNDLSKWYYTGFSGTSLQGSAMQQYWYTQRSTISGNMISTELIRRNNDTKMASYETEISAMDEAGISASGGTVLSMSQNVVYIDNINIYPIKSYTDIALNCDDNGRIEVLGESADGTTGAVSGKVSAQAFGAATVNDMMYAAGTGIGYVAVTYEDAAGINKHKVIQTGNAGETGAMHEFEIISDVKMYDETGSPLAVFESNKPVYVKADLKRTALNGNGAMLVVAIHDFETGHMVSVQTVRVDAVQRVGESFELYTKMHLPENASGNLYAKVMVMSTGQEPVGVPFEV